jgi:hypothetical protein
MEMLAKDPDNLVVMSTENIIAPLKALKERTNSRRVSKYPLSNMAQLMVEALMKYFFCSMVVTPGVFAEQMFEGTLHLYGSLYFGRKFGRNRHTCSIVNL